MKTIKIILVDDHKLVLDGFKLLLANHDNLKIIGEANNGEEAVKLVEELEADLVLMDINLPGGINGIEATKEIKLKFPHVKVMMLSMNDDEDYIIKSDIAGADAYLLKNIEKDELIEAINSVISGNKYFSKSIDSELAFNIINKKYLKESAGKGILTSREIDIIKEIAKGSSNKEIAEKLFISDRTVNTHKTNIYKKLDVKNSVELLIIAKEKKFI